MKLFAVTELLCHLALALLLFGVNSCRAQSGYNYGRSDVNSPAIGAAAGAIRPIVPISSPATGGAAYPTTGSTAFGGTGGGGGGGAVANAPYAGFGAQSGIVGAGGVAAGAYSPAAATGYGAPKRPVLPQRSGIFGGGGGNIAGAGQTAQFAGRVGNVDLDYADGDYSAIPGVPAVDYPVYAQVPPTNFDCAQQLPGYYADVEAQCQVFHICALNRTYSFLCPNGTIFSQETLVCVWWNQFECATAPALYANNAYIYDYGGERATVGGGGVGYGASGARTPTNYAAGVGRPGSLTVSASTPSAPGGIFGTASGLRGNAYANVPTAVTPSGGFGSNIASGRFMGASTPPTQSFAATASGVAATPAPYGAGAVLRSGGVGGGGGGGSGVVSAGNYPSAATGNNREYLPPPRRQ